MVMGHSGSEQAPSLKGLGRWVRGEGLRKVMECLLGLLRTYEYSFLKYLQLRAFTPICQLQGTSQAESAEKTCQLAEHDQAGFTIVC